jgi:Xaa-Pro dipeptidase
MDNILSHLKTPKEGIAERVSNLQKEMTSENLDGVMILQQADKFYFSGTVQNGVIYIPLDGKPVFMVRKSLDRAREESELDTIVPFKSYSQIPGILKEYGFESYQNIGLELDVMPVAIFRKLQEVFSETEMVDASKPIKKIRMVKSDYEIKTMKKAGQILKSAMEAVPGLLHEGMTEIDLAAETEIILRKNGHQGIIRMRKWPCCTSGGFTKENKIQ